MSTTADKLTQAASGQVANVPRAFPQMIEALKKQVALALPRHLNADRMARIALTEFRKNPKLAECDPATVFASVVIAAQLGLEPGVIGQGFLIPYKDQCTFVPGWMGLVDLAQRSGRASVWTGAVFLGDVFEYNFGSEPRITHEVGGEDDPDKLTHTYAVGRVKGSDYPVIDVWPVQKLIRHRNRYNKVGQRHYSYQNWEMYCRKIPLLQVLKYMPKSVELARALEAEYAGDTGKGVSLTDAIEGTFMVTPPVAEPVAEAPEKGPAPFDPAASQALDKEVAARESKG